MRAFTYTAGLLLALLIGFVAGGKAARDQKAELMQLDREFDEAVARGGSEAWTSYFAEDGMMMPNNGNIVMGKAAIREAMSKSFSDPNFVMRWEPVGGDVSGSLGYTYGLYRMSRPGRGGETVTGNGKYVTIWKKLRGEGWKIAVDIGNPSPAPEKK